MYVSPKLERASPNVPLQKQCIDSQDKYIASWSNHERILRVTPRASAMLDRLVVTCFLNVWFKRLGRW